jgi:PRC-barrel domain
MSCRSLVAERRVGPKMCFNYRIAAAMMLIAFSATTSGAVLKSPAAQPSTEHPLDPSKAPIGPPRKAAVAVFDSREVQGILGKEVHGAVEEDMGRIINVVVDRTGQVRAAIIEFGGFLGVGSRKIAVAWDVLQFLSDAKKGDRVALGLTRDQVRAAPEFKEDKPIILQGASGSVEPPPFP